ncbi:hypothetical protein GOBAR_DD13211 [Gossypium barbadense]|nr:hypothetical protein GOBAR_DD13211 [Gossypium barbadense]
MGSDAPEGSPPSPTTPSSPPQSSSDNSSPPSQPQPSQSASPPPESSSSKPGKSAPPPNESNPPPPKLTPPSTPTTQSPPSKHSPPPPKWHSSSSNSESGSKSNTSSSLPIILGLLAGVVLLLIIITTIITVACCRKKKKANHDNPMQYYNNYTPSQGELDDKDVGNDKNPHISIHATSGVTATGYWTIRVIGRAKKRPLHILINSRSAHNFLDLETAKKLGCKITTVKPMKTYFEGSQPNKVESITNKGMGKLLLERNVIQLRCLSMQGVDDSSINSMSIGVDESELPRAIASK